MNRLPTAGGIGSRDSIDFIEVVQSGQCGRSDSTAQTDSADSDMIECARKFFASLNDKKGKGVQYDIVTDYSELMQLVAG